MIYPADKKLAEHTLEPNAEALDLFVYSKRQNDGSYKTHNIKFSNLAVALEMSAAQFHESYRSEEVIITAGVGMLSEPPSAIELVGLFYSGVRQLNSSVTAGTGDFTVSSTGQITLPVGSDIPNTAIVTVTYPVIEDGPLPTNLIEVMATEEQTFTGGTLTLSETPEDNALVQVFYTGILMNHGLINTGQSDFSVSGTTVTRDPAGLIPTGATVTISYSKLIVAP